MKAVARKGSLTLLASCLLACLAASPAAALPAPLSSFGSAGNAAGQLQSPRGIAVDGNGRIYVAEASPNNRISVFNANGSFVHAFGIGVDTGAATFQVCTALTTCEAGLGLATNGAIFNPRGLAVDAGGNLYVAEAGNHRITVYNTAGPSHVRSFGWDVAEPNDMGAGAFETCGGATTCRTGETAGTGGNLNNPRGVALDSLGRLHVSESSHHRISVFNSAVPSFIHAFGWDVLNPDGTNALETCTPGLCLAGDPVSSGGGLSSPFGVAIDAGGDLYVSEEGNQRVSQFNSEDQTFTRSFGWDVAEPDDAGPFEFCTTPATCRAGDAGAGAGQFSDPKGAAVDAAGNLYISDDDNNRLSVFNPLVPSFTHAFGWDVIPAGASGLFEVCTTALTCGPGTSGSGVGQFNDPEALATDCRGNVWVADLNNGRVQRFGEPGTPLPPCTTPPTGGGGGTITAPPPPAKKKCKKGQKLKKGKCVKKKRKKKK